MKTLVLMRHGEAGDAARDHARPLSARGRQQCCATAAEIERRGLAIDRVLSSSAVRAVESARLVVETLGLPDTIDVREALYLAEPATYAEAARGFGADVATVLLVAHNPGLSDLASRIQGRHVGLSTAAVAVCELPIADWRELLA